MIAIERAVTVRRAVSTTGVRWRYPLMLLMCYFSLKICCKINVFIRYSGHISDVGTKNAYLETTADSETVSRGTEFITTHCRAPAPTSWTRKPYCRSVTSIHLKSFCRCSLRYGHSLQNVFFFFIILSVQR